MNVKSITHIAIFAAIYVVLTTAIAPLSFGAIQCRISDIMIFFCLGDKKNAVGYALGGLIANIFSPLGVIDLAVGLISNSIIGICAYKTKSEIITSLVSVFAPALLIGAELSIVYSTLFWVNCAYVATGMAAVCIVGVIVHRVVRKNNKIYGFIMGEENNNADKKNQRRL